MTDATRDVLNRALELSSSERANLVLEILDSLDLDGEASLPGGELDPEWRAEIERRFARTPKPDEPSPDAVIAQALRRVDELRRAGGR